MAENRVAGRAAEMKANANLVLQSSDRTYLHGPSGEPESLRGQKNLIFGDRVVRQKPLDFVQKREIEDTEKEIQERDQQRALLSQQRSILDTVTEVWQYQPKTQHTQLVYGNLLTLVNSILGDQPDDVIRSAAEEAMEQIFDEKKTAPQKRTELETVFGKLSEEVFSEITQLVLALTDYKSKDEVDEGMENAYEDDLLNDVNEQGVSVVFDSDDEKSDLMRFDPEKLVKQIVDDADNDNDEGEDTLMADQTEHVEQQMRIKSGAKVEEEALAQKAKVTDIEQLDPNAIDGYWLQRKIRETKTGADDDLPRRSEKILNALNSSSLIMCNTILVEELGLENYQTIQLFLNNRFKIYYCTRLAQAPEEEKAQIRTEMAANPATLDILQQLMGLELGKHGIDKKSETKAESKQAAEDSAKAKVISARALNLEDLSFTNGSHYMSRKECKLPAGSYRESKKGFEEVGIPMPKPPKGSDQLVPISSLPDWVQPIFPYKTLTRIQSRIFETAFYKPDNFLVCAPTGSGKTNVAMLSMLHEIGLHRETNGEIRLDEFKIVYVAPMKSLVQEMVGNFSKRLGPLGLTVKELSGDISLTKAQLAETQVIVTTPEKWDIITRKAGDKAFTQSVRLVILDEVHLLHDTRGPVLEAIVSRTVRQIEQTKDLVRIVGLSATLPGYEDVATFLRVKSEHVFAFDNAYRPVPLEQQYIGITEKSSVKRYNMMNEITYTKLLEHAGVHQVLVFVHSRKETAKVAKELRDMAVDRDDLEKFLKETSGSRAVIATEVRSVISADLREVLPYGFAIHHAGMARSDRTLVEELFADGHIQVLVSTSTLAWGVNLPAHTVIIRGTQVYSPEQGCWTELGPLDVMQMIGRAGRPQFDTEGRGIIITSYDKLHFYLSLLNHQLPIESQLISTLPDVLNAEVVLGNVTSLQDAAEWLTYTYLYVCMLRSPSIYGVSIDESEKDKLLYQRRLDLAHSAAMLLDRAHLIQYDRKTGLMQATDLGAVSSHYYISHKSIMKYNEFLKPTLSDIDLFRLFSLSNEFANIPVRKEERAELEALLDKVPIPVKESIEDPAAKINVLLQSYISRVNLTGLAISADMVYVSQSAARIARALFEIVLRRDWANLAKKALTLCKMIEKRMWLSQSPLRQFASLPMDVLRRLDRVDMSLDHLYQLTSQELGSLVASPQSGHKLFTHVHAFPKCELSVGVTPITRSCLRLDVAIASDFNFYREVHGNSIGWWLIVEDCDSERILHHEYVTMKAFTKTAPIYVTFTITVGDPLPPQCFVRLLGDRWLGAETTLPVSLRHLTLPEKFPPHTELFDLKPLPITALNVPSYISLYQNTIRELNPVQTQTFSALYDSSENVFIGAPSASGKTFCGELALMHLWNSSEEAHPLAVYIQPVKSLAHDRYLEWKKRFGDGENGNGLKKVVVELTGEAADVDLCANADIVVSTPEQWDSLSRGWKRKRNPTRSVRLFIVDDLHLLGDEVGPILEVVVARMRIVSFFLEQEQAEKEKTEKRGIVGSRKRIRFIGLSYSVANGRDIAEWIGATPTTLFNFHPNIRFTPFEIYIQNFENPNFTSRMHMMVRPTIQTIKRRAAGKPTIIFCPTKRQVMSMVSELVQVYDPEDLACKFLKVPLNELAPALKIIRTKTLSESAQSGVVFLHEGQPEREREVVKALFSSGAVQILVASHEQCWSMGVQASTVIIMGTEYPSGHIHVDYPVSTLLKMVGRATRVGIDKVAKCSILCYAPKKAYYVKFLEDALPVESHLHETFADTLNAEIASEWIITMQNAIDYITWCFFYRRLTQNPNAYNLTGTSQAKLSVYLSELIQRHIDFLVEADCVKLDEPDEEDEEGNANAENETRETRLSSLNLGFIAAHYYIHCTTVELFKKSLTERTKLKGLLDILSNASEYSELPLRQHEEGIIRKIAIHLPVKISSTDYKDPHVKTNVLLQSFFNRVPLTSDLSADQSEVLNHSRKLVRALVDVIGSAGWLTPCIAAMELAQMCVQGLWSSDSPLKQVPHLTQGIIDNLKNQFSVEDVFGLKEMDDKDRLTALSSLTQAQLSDVAEMCNKYPDIDMSYDVSANEARPGENVFVSIALTRTTEEDETVGVPRVHSLNSNQTYFEGWWVLVSDTKTKTLFGVRWLALARSAKVNLEFSAPMATGKHDLTLNLMSDSYLGCDQEYSFELNVSGKPIDDEDIDME